MKILIVEDDFSSRVLLQGFLSGFGASDVAVTGNEAVQAVRIALDAGEHYDLICMDIMMPEMCGQQALAEIRAMEEARGLTSTFGAKIIMCTALSHPQNVFDAFGALCDAFIVKPIRKNVLLEVINDLMVYRDYSATKCLSLRRQ